MPNGNQLPFGWREYKAYLEAIVKEIDYPGAWDKPERKADLERMISEAESILGPSPEMAFTAGNFNRLMSLPHFAPAFEYSTGTSPTSWYNLYVKTAPEAVAPAPTGVESRGGYDFLVDEAGNIISSLGRTPDVAPEELTRWQQAQLQQAQQEMAWQREQAMWGREQAMLPYGQMTAYQQAQMQLSRMQYAAQLAAMGEEGWIEQYYGQQAPQAPQAQPSPPWYAPGLTGMAGWPAMSPEERGDWLRQFQYSQKWTGIDPTIQAQVQAGWGFPQAPPGEQISYGEPSPIPWGGQKEIDIKPSGEIKITEGGEVHPREAQPSISGTRPHPRGGLGGFQAPPFPVGEPPPREARRPTPPPVPPAGPPAPAWLPQFAPWTTVGEPITRGQMPTPSGQMWAATPPSVQAGLRGFAKWGGAGRSMEDILQHMYAMQPQAPRGAGYQRWSPARQWG